MVQDIHHMRQRRNRWFLQVAVPKALQPELGKRTIEEPLGESLTIARQTRDNRLDHWRREFRRRLGGSSLDDPLTVEAINWRNRIEGERDHLRRGELSDQVVIRAVEGPWSPRKAGFLHDVARGKATPLMEHLESWLAESTFTERTKADHRHAVRKLGGWLREHYSVAAVEALDDKVAARFKSNELVAKGVNRKTANKLLSSLRSYWRWLQAHGYAASNVWLGKSLPKGRQSDDEREREFSDGELVALLNGKADATLRDVMLIGVLSGLRLEELFRLTVADCQGGTFKVRKSKTSAGERIVPIHSQLADIVARRSEGKGVKDFLIEEGEPTGWDGMRSMSFSKRFRTYREACEVNDKQEGRRRSRVNFHSFRRTFATKAEQAGHHESLVARVLGHKLNGMSFGTYSGGASDEQLRQVVESVRLPTQA